MWSKQNISKKLKYLNCGFSTLGAPQLRPLPGGSIDMPLIRSWCKCTTLNRCSRCSLLVLYLSPLHNWMIRTVLLQWDLNPRLPSWGAKSDGQLMFIILECDAHYLWKTRIINGGYRSTTIDNPMGNTSCNISLELGTKWFAMSQCKLA